MLYLYIMNYCPKTVTNTCFIFGTNVHLYNRHNAHQAWFRHDYDHHLAAMLVKAFFAKVALSVLCVWPCSMT